MAAHLFFYLTLVLLIAIFSTDALNYKCPGVINAPQYYKKVHFEPKLGGRSGQGYTKMRFRIFYEKSMDKLPPVYKSMTQEVADFWSNVLSVRPYDGKFLIPRACEQRKSVLTYSNESKKHEEHCLGPCTKITTCGHIVIPEDHLKECNYCLKNGTECHTTGRTGKGIENVDMVFYVSAIQTEGCSDGTIAHAGPCRVDPQFHRPIAGLINVCPSSTWPSLNEKQHVVSVLKHETMHIFAFAPPLFNLFRDSNGEPLVERDKYGAPIFKWDNGEFGPKVVKTVERKWHVRGGIVSSSRTFIVTPNVVREARAHFNCSDLEGAELEDSGRNWSNLAHWEARVYYDDIMKGEDGPGELQMSRIDFALLEDTGWYKVNYSLAEPIKFGKNLGCDFCMKSCKYWMDKKRSEGKSVEPFCDQTEQRSSNYLCNKTDKIYSKCPLKRNKSPMPKRYQYFDSLEEIDNNDLHFYSGIDMSADYCPIPLTALIDSCNQQLTSEEKLYQDMNPLSNIPLEGFGNNAYCFESRTNWTVKEYKDTCSQVKSIGKGHNAGCYKYSCLSGLLVLEVSNKRFPCFFEGQVLEIHLFGLVSNATHEGSIVCPSCEQICGQSSDFKCLPENPKLASKYLYARDECIDGDYLKKMIKSLDAEGRKSSSAIKEAKEAHTMGSDTWTKLESLTPIGRASEASTNNGKFHQRNQYCKLCPTNLIRVLLAFIVIVNL